MGGIPAQERESILFYYSSVKYPSFPKGNRSYHYAKCYRFTDCSGEEYPGGNPSHASLVFADLYMEVKADCRNQGYGSFILQEIKKECYQAGRVPAARCSMTNKASRTTLIKAGFRICGFMLTGEIRDRIGKGER